MWLEAWNIYIQGMVRYHPKLAPELLSYLESICGFQLIYPLTAWLKYDPAFRMAMGLNKSLSWSRTDDYAFNKFLRSAGASALPNQTSQTQQKTCFRCSSPGHLANNCPAAMFRPSAPQPPNFQPSSLRVATVRQPLSRTAAQASKPACLQFNYSSCFRRYCAFSYKCLKCEGFHPAANCKLSS